MMNGVWDLLFLPPGEVLPGHSDSVCRHSGNAVCDVCGQKVRSFGDTTNLVERLRVRGTGRRLNHNTEHEAFMTRRAQEESAASGAAALKTPAVTFMF